MSCPGNHVSCPGVLRKGSKLRSQAWHGDSGSPQEETAPSPRPEERDALRENTGPGILRLPHRQKTNTPRAGQHRRTKGSLRAPGRAPPLRARNHALPWHAGKSEFKT